MAAELSAAFQARDMEAFGALLAADARWGGDTVSNRCRSRTEVIDTFRRQISAGAEGQVAALEVGPEGILCQLTVTSPAVAGGVGPGTLFHLYRVRGERIVEIVPFVDRRLAVAALGSGRRGTRGPGKRS
ncbi:MAG: nuclear transport factor 2 family protein [Candidatus Dormibacteria bacterium]